MSSSSSRPPQDNKAVNRILNVTLALAAVVTAYLVVRALIATG